MAGPAELVEQVSRATGIAPPTVIDIDRKLVAADLRTKNGRGRNAARVTALDAARLLTALLASSQANKATEAVERYTATRIDKDRSTTGLSGAADVEHGPSSSIHDSFIDGLAQLITWAATSPLFRTAHADVDLTHPRIEVFAFTRATRGRIRITGLPDGMTISTEYTQRARDRAEVAEIGDLEQSRRITERTIIAIGELFREGPQP